MSEVGQSILVFAGPLAIGRIFELVFRTPWGKDLAQATGNSSLTTDEGRRIIRRYSGAAAAIALGLAFVLRQRPTGKPRPQRDRVETFRLFAELLLSGGALLKIVADYTEDRRDIEHRMRAFR
ncbi:MAG: hypothetical protein ACYC1C_06380 [Chloroflexota bacterium]